MFPFAVINVWQLMLQSQYKVDLRYFKLLLFWLVICTHAHTYPAFSLHFTFALLQSFSKLRLIPLATELLL